MLPPGPPELSRRDIDPAQEAENAENATELNDRDFSTNKVEISSVEINILIYLYLLESNFSHTAFTLLAESQLPSTSLFQHFYPSFPSPSTANTQPTGYGSGSSGAPGISTNGPLSARASSAKINGKVDFGRGDARVPRGELVRKLWKAVRWEEVERHVAPNGDQVKVTCPNPFHLLLPHVCPTSVSSSSLNPPLPLPSALRRLSPVPQTRSQSPAPSTRRGGEPAPLSVGLSSRRRDRDADRDRDSSNGRESRDKGKRKARDSPLPRKRGREADAVPEPEAEVEAEVEVEAEAADEGEGEQEAEQDQEADDQEQEPEPEQEQGPEVEQEQEEAKPEQEEQEEQREEEQDQEGEVEQEGENGDGTESEQVNGDNETADAVVDDKEAMDVDEPEAAPRTNGRRREAKGETLSPDGSKKKRRDGTSVANTPGNADRGSSKSPALRRKDSPGPKQPVSVVPGVDGDVSDVSMWAEHRDAVTCLSWNPVNPESLVTGGGDGTARLWDLRPNSQGRALELVKKPAVISHKSIDTGKKVVTVLAWHPDGTVLATATSDGVGRLFTPSGQLQGILSYGRGAINALKFSPSGSSLLVARDDFTVTLVVLGFDLKSQRQLAFEAHTKEVNDVDWLDDDVFASAGNDHLVLVHRANDRRPRFTLRGHTDDVTRVRWAPQGSAANGAGGTQRRLLASASDDGYVMIWRIPEYPEDRGTGSRSLSPVKREAAVAAALGSPAGGPGSTTGTGQGLTVPGSSAAGDATDDYFHQATSMAHGFEHCVRRLAVVDGSDNKRMSTLEWCPAAAKNGRMIIAAGGQDTTVKLFDALSGDCLHVLNGLENGTGSIAFAPATRGLGLGVIAAGGWDARAFIWDVETGKQLKAFEVEEEARKQNSRDRPMMLNAAWSGDARYLALGLHNKALMTIYAGDLVEAASEAAAAKEAEAKIEAAAGEGSAVEGATEEEGKAVAGEEPGKDEAKIEVDEK